MKTKTVSRVYPRKSEILWEEASRLIPGGVNSPVRSFRAVDGTPLFIDKASGSKITDADGNEYIDYVMGWGPLILGHANPQVADAVHQALLKGSTFGAPTEGEVWLARAIQEAMPSLEKVRLVNSGTEATMTALRLARAYTRRGSVVKFEGCYHGHVDALLVAAGSGAMTHSIPDSQGLPPHVTETTYVLPYNDLSKAAALFKKEGKKIACVIVEPVAANMGVVLPRPGFLEGLRALTRRYENLLIFDEVVTGFRVARGGAQERFGISPDLTTLGKIIGGGLPIGALGGKKEIMRLLSPEGPVYQAGTLSGNSLSVAAGNATLTTLSRQNTYEALEEKGATLEEVFREAFSKKKRNACFNRIGSLFAPFFGVGSVSHSGDVRKVNKKIYGLFFHACLKEGLYFPPSPFEASFLSLAHTPEDLLRTREVLLEAIEEL